MPSFVRYSKPALTTGNTLKTVSQSAGNVVIGMLAANVTGSTDTVSISITDNAATPVTTYLAKNVSVPTGTSLSLEAGKTVLNNGDTVKAWCGTDNSIEVTLSVLEL